MCECLDNWGLVQASQKNDLKYIYFVILFTVILRSNRILKEITDATITRSRGCC
jgi:hypothetical protein